MKITAQISVPICQLNINETKSCGVVVTTMSVAIDSESAKELVRKLQAALAQQRKTFDDGTLVPEAENLLEVKFIGGLFASAHPAATMSARNLLSDRDRS